jgi:NADH-quinone oxidoreductase subunit J
VPSQLVDLLFAASAVSLLVLSIAVVVAKNPVRSTLLLILSFLPTALIYVMLQAPFVGILQILVYGGAIMMLFTFVIMMINPAPRGGEIPDEANHPDHGNPPSLRILALWVLLLVAAGFAILPPIYRAASTVTPTAVIKPGFGTLASLADFIFKDPAHNPLTVSFELISFLILVGIIAAVNFGRRRQSHHAEETL